MRILFIHQYAFGPSVAGFTRPIEIMAELIKRNHEATMISGMFSHITRKKIPMYNSSLVEKENILGVEVYRVSGLFNLTSSLKKLLHHLLVMTLSIYAGLFVRRVDIVIASSPSPFVGLAGYVLSRLKGIPFVLEVRDLWPEDLLQEGLMKPGLSTSLMEKLMQFLYIKSARILAVTGGIRDGIIRRGISDKKVVLVSNSVNTAVFRKKTDISEIRKEIGIDNEFVVLYAGNHGISNALETIIEAARQLESEKNVLFVLVGDGEEKNNLIQIARQYGLANIKFVPPQRKSRMPDIFATANASVVPLKNVPVYEGALPNKLLDSMASGTPVILATGAEARRIVEDSKGGLCVEPENASQLAEAVRTLARDRKATEHMGKNGQRYVLENYSHETMAEKMEKELRDVVAGASR
jgi:glycosyltransferase involved in cell wall biosynthesis